MKLIQPRVAVEADADHRQAGEAECFAGQCLRRRRQAALKEPLGGHVRDLEVRSRACEQAVAVNARGRDRDPLTDELVGVRLRIGRLDPRGYDAV